MKAKTIKTHKLKNVTAKNKGSEPKNNLEVRNEDGFENSKALSPQEIEDLKETLEELNRQNTIGG